MELIEGLHTRRAVRAFTDRQVEPESVKELIRSAIQAPSAMNCQPWSFVVLQDRALLGRLSDRAKDLLLEREPLGRMPPDMKQMLADPGYSLFHGAGTLIVILAHPQGRHPDWDCCLAAENLMLAAHASGLATCPIGLSWPVFELPEVRHELGIPDDYQVILPVIVGYPRGTTPRVPRREPEILCWKGPA